MTSDAGAQASRIFLTHSPYHCLLAYAIAVDDEVPSLLCYRPYYPRAQARPFFEFLRSLDVFVECHLLASMYKDQNTWKRPLARMPAKHRNFTRMRSLIQRHPIREVCGVLDDRDLTQFVMQTATAMADEPVTCAIIEDGAAIYTPLRGRKRWTPYTFPSLHAWLHRRMYGYPYQPPPTVGFYGDFELVDRLYAHAPAHVADRYHEHEVVEIPAWPLGAIDRISLRTLFADSGLAWEQLEGIDGIVLAPYLRTSEATARFARVVQQLTEAGIRVGYKPHPRLQIPEGGPCEDVVTIPAHLPSELLMVALSGVSFILGIRSTALLSAKWIDADLVAISLLEPVSTHQLAGVYDAMGVISCESSEDVERALF